MTATLAQPVNLAKPANLHERIGVVDILRGFALLGILLVNIGLFRGPDNPAALAARPLADQVVAWFTTTLADGKFVSMFSYLFGLGMFLQMTRIEAHGGPFVKIYLRRLAALLFFGLCHLIFFWDGDILLVYALTGFLAFLLRKRSTRTIRRLAIISLSLVAVILVALVGVALAAAITGNSVALNLGDFLSTNPPDSPEALATYQEDIRLFQNGSYLAQVQSRLGNLAAMWVGLLISLPFTFGMFMLGSYAGRQGFFADIPANRPVFRKMLILGIALSLLANLPELARLLPGEHEMILSLGGALKMLTAPFLSMAYLSALVLLTQSEVWKKRLAPLSLTGRMALTNYLTQTLVCTTIFYSYGLGLYGKVGAAGGFLLAVGIYVCQLFFSRWWLSRFRFGPMEWLWRSLTYGCWQPLRRSAAVETGSE